MPRPVQKKNVSKEIYLICYEDETPYTVGTKLHAYRTPGMAKQKLEGIIYKIEYDNKMADKYPNSRKYKKKEIPVLVICKFVPQSSRLVFMDID